MKLDPEDFRRHYASLSDEGLLSIDRNELVEVAQTCYDEEISRRGLQGAAKELVEPELAAAEPYTEPVLKDGEKPDWLEHAGCAASFLDDRKSELEIGKAGEVLTAARIPWYAVTRPDWEDEKTMLYELMVPNHLLLEAWSVLEEGFFKPWDRAWKAHLEDLTDEELRATNPKRLVAAFLDRAARLTRAYNDEIAKRGLRRDAAEDDGPSGAGG